MSESGVDARKRQITIGFERYSFRIYSADGRARRTKDDDDIDLRAEI